VDFGGGLERIAMILQNKKSSFEIDYWEPIMQTICKIYQTRCKKSPTFKFS
jgi:alanyl-tRNA synthetase